MYCVNCGVKLSDSERVCPLCSTAVYHPDLTCPDGNGTYPKKKAPKSEPKPLGFAIFATACMAIPIPAVLASDLNFNGSITFSGYVIGAILLAYIALILPSWFKRPNPVIFVPCTFAAALLYLGYINLATGGDWFMTFALPVTLAVTAIVVTPITLMRYLSRGRLYIFGGTFIALGALMPLIEILLGVTFTSLKFIGWFIYPLSTFALLGGFLIFLGICRPAREHMERLFFI